MKYETEASCHCCNKVIVTFEHDDLDFLKNVFINEMLATARRQHALESPRCAADPRWMRGWCYETYKVEDITVRTDVPTLPPYWGPI
jgi:hypothetical protein